MPCICWLKFYGDLVKVSQVNGDSKSAFGACLSRFDSMSIRDPTAGSSFGRHAARPCGVVSGDRGRIAPTAWFRAGEGVG